MENAIKVGDKLIQWGTGLEHEVFMTSHRNYDRGYVGVRCLATGKEGFPLNWDGACPSGYSRASEVPACAKEVR